MLHLPPQRARFFTAFDARPAGQAVITFCQENKDQEWCPSQPTASRWIRHRERALAEEQLPPQQRRPRKKKPGPKRKDVSHEVALISAGADLPRKKDYAASQNEVGVSYSTLRRRITEQDPPIVRSRRRREGGISAANKELRLAYGRKHENETVDTLWQWIHWTDDACIDRAVVVEQFMVREEGSGEAVLMQQPASQRLVLHLAASVSWHHKSDLIFYNDADSPHSDDLDAWKQAKPRRNRGVVTEEQYQTDLAEWRSSQPAKTLEAGNATALRHYSREVLPQYVKHIHDQKASGMPAIMMQDGDASHTLLPANAPPTHAHEKARIQLHDHPPQSLDLHPMEGIWVLLNERLKALYQDELNAMDYWQLREAVQRCWATILQQEIRDRIAEMPKRCKRLVANGGKRITGQKW